jgi:endonuclease-3
MTSNMNTRSKTAKFVANNSLDSEKTSTYFNKNIENKDKTQLTSIKDFKEIDDNSSQTKKRKVSKHIEIKYESKEPKNWLKVLENIREMRSKRDAVVDQMGSEMCFDNKCDQRDQRFQVLISLMLSSQTRDQITHKTTKSLIEYGLTVDNIIETSEEVLRDRIKSVSFYNTKAKHIKRTALILRDQYESDIPNSVEKLTSLPGVGPKMAHLAMQIAWNECTGIAVDTHVHRICNRLGWTQSKTPEQTRKQLESWLPKEHWYDINLLLVGFGQTICTPLRPKCDQCLNQKLCPYASSNESD